MWAALLVGTGERLAYYSLVAPWQNYMQNNRSDGAAPGALGLGQSKATNISNAFQFFSYLTPVFAGIASDAWLGRYQTLCISLVLAITALPAVLDRGGGPPGLAVAMLLTGCGVGGVKSTISPFIGDQYPVKPPQVKVTRKGLRVILDRTMTLQYIYNLFYWMTNIAAMTLLASTFLERRVGFWAAWLLSTCSFVFTIPLLLIYSNRFVKIPVKGNVLISATKVFKYACRGRFNHDAARPQHQLQKHGRTVPWTDLFVSEIKRGLLASKVMIRFIPYYLSYNQLNNNLVSQAGQMKLGGFLNDGIQVLNVIACIILGPLIQKLLYPTLARHGIDFGPIARITVAFLAMAASMGYAAVVQRLVYDAGPCFEAPLQCAAARGGGNQPPRANDISVFIQTPVYVFLAVAEILGLTTLSEYSYSKAPRDMRTVVQAFRQIVAGIGSSLGMALSPVSKDPEILWLYTSLAVSMAVIAALFWYVAGKFDRIDQELDALDLIKDHPSSEDENVGNDEEKAEAGQDSGVPTKSTEQTRSANGRSVTGRDRTVRS